MTLLIIAIIFLFGGGHGRSAAVAASTTVGSAGIPAHIRWEREVETTMQCERGKPILYKRLDIPAELLTTSVDEDCNTQTFGGDVRIGDLDGDGAVDFLVFRNIHGTKPMFMGAFNMDGEVLWKVGKGGDQPMRPGPVAIHDINADGKNEIICLFHKPDVESPAGELRDVVAQIRDGRTGEVKAEDREDETYGICLGGTHGNELDTPTPCG